MRQVCLNISQSEKPDLGSYSKDTKKGHFAPGFAFFWFTPHGLLGEIVRWDGLFVLARPGFRYGVTTPDSGFSTNSYVGNLCVFWDILRYKSVLSLFAVYIRGGKCGAAI